MPSRKPRVALTVPDDLNALFDRISDLNGTPKTKLMIELLEAYKPVLEEMLDTLEKIHADKENAQKIVKQFGQNLVMEASSILGDVSKELRDLSC
jgi:Mor family transcriptional regulator